MNDIALYKSEDMSENNYLSAESPSGESVKDIFDKHGIICETYGINIATTYYNKKLTDGKKHITSDQLADGILNQYREKESNRENLILSDYEIYGVGVSITENNKVYHTQVFCNN